MIFLKTYREQIIMAAMSVALVTAIFLALRDLISREKYKINGSDAGNVLLGFNSMMLAERYTRYRKLCIACCVGGLGLVFFLVFGNLVFSIILGVCVSAVIDEFVSSLRERNNLKMHMQTISFISHMILMLKAGKTVRQIFKSSVFWAKNPLKLHLEIMVNQLESSIPFGEAVDNFSARCASSEIKLLASALKINHRIGGDLIFILENISDSLRHSLKSRSKAKTLTIQSRFSATIISFFPIAALVMLYFFMNERVTAFFSSSFANVILLAGGFLEIAGILAMKKIVGGNQ
ncbi:MAG: type II secretion system F family protein [Actinomycetota bacterium]